jgi:hypothetical protein
MLPALLGDGGVTVEEIEKIEYVYQVPPEQGRKWQLAQLEGCEQLSNR